MQIECELNMGHKRLWIPGPVEVHPDILQACAVPMISHRGKDYQKIHSSAKAGLRKMLGTDKGVEEITRK